MFIAWRGRFFLLLIPCFFGLFLFFFWQVQTTTTVTLDQSYAVSNGSSNPQQDEHASPKILLVSAFFPFSKSKHTMAEYEWWLSTFLERITTDIYFYAPPEMEDLVRRCRKDLPITINTTYSSPFEIPPLSPYRDHYQKMHALDRESFRHSPELYAVWNAKAFFLDEAVKTFSRAGKTYEYAFWNDAGSFRSTHTYKGWPDPSRVQEIWQQGSELSGQRPQDLLLFPIQGLPHSSIRKWTQDRGPVDTDFSEGSFFGGSPSTVAWWRRTFYAYHDHYLSLGLFVGKDQTVFNAILILFPSRFISVWLGDPDAPEHEGMLPVIDQGALGNCGAEWFYYQFWLATPSERLEMRKIWESRARWSWKWWKQRQQCRVTRVTSLKSLLKHRFGGDWEPPQHTIDA